LNFIPRTAVANVLQKQHLMVGFEKFYLKVGKVLHKKSAQVGLVKDGVVNASSSSREAERRGDPMPTSETIEAERIIDEQLHETHEHNNTVFNPCVAEFLGMMSEVAEMQEVHNHFEQLKRQISRQAYEQALDDGKTVGEAKREAAAKEQEFVDDVAKFQDKADDVKNTAQQITKDKPKPSQNEGVSEVALNLLLDRKSAENTPMYDAVSDMVADAVMAEEASPREKMQNFVPKNDAEAALKKATLLRYDMEDFVAKHPQAAEYCSRAFIGAMYAVQGVEYAGAFTVGNVAGVAAKYASQESISYAIEHGVDQASVTVAQAITTDAALQNEFAATSTMIAYAGLCARSVIAGKKLVGMIAKNTEKNLASAAAREAQRKIGNVGTFNDLTNRHGGAPFNDGRQAHHMPAQRYLEHHGLNTGEGLSIMMTKEQHIKTRTYGRKGVNLDLENSYRSELARDIRDVKQILKNDGSWTSEVRQSVLKGLSNFKNEKPQLFEKVKK